MKRAVFVAIISFLMGTATLAGAHTYPDDETTDLWSTNVCTAHYANWTYASRTAFARSQNNSCDSVGVYLNAVSKYHMGNGEHHYYGYGWFYSASVKEIYVGATQYQNSYTLTSSRHSKFSDSWNQLTTLY